MRACWRSLFLVLLCALVCTPVSGSLFVALSQDELVAKSDLIVVGRVTETHSFWSPDGSMVLSETVFEVEEALAGRAPVHVVVESMGGEMAGRRYEAVGVPSFRVGEKLLLFLSPGDRGSFRVAGYSQGQFRIVRDRQGEEVAVSKVQPGTLVGRGGKLIGPPAALPLDLFKQQIRARLALRGRHEQ